MSSMTAELTAVIAIVALSVDQRFFLMIAAVISRMT